MAKRSVIVVSFGRRIEEKKCGFCPGDMDGMKYRSGRNHEGDKYEF